MSPAPFSPDRRVGAAASATNREAEGLVAEVGQDSCGSEEDGTGELPPQMNLMKKVQFILDTVHHSDSSST